MIGFLIFVVLLLAGLPLLGTLAQWIAFRLARVSVTSVSVFYGTPIARFQLHGTNLAVGYIPTGSSIAYDIPAFRSRALLSRLLVILSGPVALLLFAAVFLGLPRALGHFTSGFSQLVVGALNPRTTALGFITQLHGEFSASVPAASGIIAAKLAAFAFLPLGGMAAAEIIRQILGPYAEQNAMTAFSTISAVVAILMAILWAAAIVSFAFTSIA